MNVYKYDKIYKSIKKNAPIESGIQTLVYSLLDEVLSNTDYNLVVIDRLSQKSIYTTYSGVSDLAIVDNDFSYNNKTQKGILFCVEVKTSEENIYNYDIQVLGQLLTFGKALVTNGKKWIYYDINKYIKQNSENSINEIRMNMDYKDLKEKINEVVKNKRLLAVKKTSLAHTKNEEYRKFYIDEIGELHDKLDISERKVTEELEIPWIKNILDYPIWERDLYDGDVINTKEYMLLMAEMYNTFSELF